MKSITFKKILSKVPLPIKLATRKFDFVLRILRNSATCFLVNFIESQAHNYSSLLLKIEWAIFS